MKRIIFPYDFAPYYPIGVQPCPMYVDVANRVYNRIKEARLDLPDADELKKEIAINVAIYYEDKMSGIGLWNAFVRKHLLTYLHSLPFFDDFDELDKDDVNAKEVELLIWLVISRNFKDRFLNPLAIGEEMAEAIMDILTEDDDIEVNESMLDFIYNKDKANDYFKLKQILFWLRRSYLLCAPISEERFYDLLDTYEGKFNMSEVAYYAETTFLMTTEIGPLALEPHLWLAEMYYNNGMCEEAVNLSDLEYVQQNLFRVTEANAKYAILKDTKGECYKLKNVYPDFLYIDSYICTALVKYGDDWETNGVMFNSNKKAYDKMCEYKRKLEFSYEQAYPLYMERTKGKRMAFFENKNQLKEWLREVLPEMDIDEMDYQLPSSSQVAFISKKAGIIFAPNVIHAIKCKDNPYYRKCDASKLQKETMDAVLNIGAMHPEMLNYLLENNMLQYGDISSMAPNDIGNEIFTHYIDFIARNHRRHYYHDHDY